MGNMENVGTNMGMILILTYVGKMLRIRRLQDV